MTVCVFYFTFILCLHTRISYITGFGKRILLFFKKKFENFWVKSKAQDLIENVPEGQSSKITYF